MNTLTLLDQLDRLGFAAMQYLLSALWQSSLLFAATFALAWFQRKRRASVRHLIWVATLLVAPLLPVLTSGVRHAGAPQAPVAVLPSYAPSAPLPRMEPLPEPPPSPVVSAPFVPAPREIESHPVISAPRSHPWVWCLAAYGVGLAFLFAWIVAGRLRIRHWIRSARPATRERVLSVFQSALEGTQPASRRTPLPFLSPLSRVEVLEGPGVPAPISTGILHPRVLLPIGLADRLSDEELRAVGLHEIAHLKRRDPFVLTLAVLVRAILFFHPLVWLAARQISALAEQCADDAVLEATGQAVPYARLLARLAEELPHRPFSAEMATGLLLGKSAFLRRVEAILSGRRSRLSRLALVVTLIAVLVSLVIALAVPLGEKKDPKSASSEKAEWGIPVEGVQVRLKAEKKIWQSGETPRLQADILNQGTREWSVTRAQELCEVEVDSAWYRWEGSIDVKSSYLPPKRQYNDIAIVLDSHWRRKDNGTELSLTKGTHKIRAFFTLDPVKDWTGPDPRVVSNPVEIEVLPAEGELADKATLGFLADLPEFRELDLSVTEKMLQRMIAEKGLRNISTKDRVMKTCHVYRGDGENVIVMFKDGKCSGIQRMRKDASYADKLFNGLGKLAKSLQVSLRADKKVWKTGEDLALKVDVRNVGQEDVAIYRDGNNKWEIEVDGQWYWPTGATTALAVMVAPGEKILDISVPPTWTRPLEWRAKSDEDPGSRRGRLLTLGPGRHTVRVATYPVMYSVDAEGRPLMIEHAPSRVVRGVQPTPGKPVRAVSNPIEIEVAGKTGGNPAEKKDSVSPAQEGSASKVPENGGTENPVTRTIRGRVVDKDGKPVAGMLVEWGRLNESPTTRYRTRTNDQGRYALHVERYGVGYRLGVAGDARYAPAWYDSFSPWDLVQPPPRTDQDAPPPSEKNFGLEPAHRLEGIVVDEAGQPIDGAIVKARTPARFPGGIAVESDLSTLMIRPPTLLPGQGAYESKTFEDGRFHLDAMPAGQVNLSVTAPHRYANNANYLVDTPCRIVMKGSGRPGIIRAGVTDARTGRPVPDFTVALRKVPEHRRILSQDGALAWQEKDMTSGSRLEVHVFAKGYAPWVGTIAAADVRSTDPLTVASITLTPAPPLLVRFVDARDGKPVAGAKAMLAVSDGSPQFHWNGWDLICDGHSNFTWVQRAESDAEGRLWFCEDPAKPETLFVLAPGFGRTVIRPAERPQADSEGWVRVALKPGASIEGTLARKAGRVANTKVQLQKQGSSLPNDRWYDETTANATGHFAFDRLAPGNYTVSVEHRLSYWATEPKPSLPVTLGPGEKRALGRIECEDDSPSADPPRTPDGLIVQGDDPVTLVIKKARSSASPELLDEIARVIASNRGHPDLPTLCLVQVRKLKGLSSKKEDIPAIIRQYEALEREVGKNTEIGYTCQTDAGYLLYHYLNDYEAAFRHYKSMEDHPLLHGDDLQSEYRLMDICTRIAQSAQSCQNKPDEVEKYAKRVLSLSDHYLGMGDREMYQKFYDLYEDAGRAFLLEFAGKPEILRSVEIYPSHPYLYRSQREYLGMPAEERVREGPVQRAPPAAEASQRLSPLPPEVAPAAAPAGEQRKKTVFGVVKDAKGQPLEGAKVVFAAVMDGGSRVLATAMDAGTRVAEPCAMAKTAHDGSFVLDLPDEPTTVSWRLLAFKPGYACDGTNLMQLDRVAERSPFDFVLAEPRRLTGQAVNTKGEPVSGALVYPSAYRPSLLGKAGHEIHIDPALKEFASRTDASGRFLLEQIPSDWQADPPYLSITHPSYVDLRVGANSDNPAFERKSDGYRVVLTPGGKIRGRVFDPASNRPAAGFRIHSISRFWRSVMTDAEGRYEFTNMAPGEYWLGPYVPSRMDAGSGFLEGIVTPRSSVILGEGQTLEGVDLVMHPGVLVQGRVIAKETLKGVPGAFVTGKQRKPGGKELSWKNAVETDAEGRFTILAPEGEVILWARSWKYGGPSPEQTLALRIGQTPPEVAFTLQKLLPDPLVVRGVVLDPEGKPAAGVMVGSLGSWDSSLTRTNEAGRFTLRPSLAPDQILAIRAITPDKSLSALLILGDTKADLTIRLRPCGAMSGRVVDQDKRPIAGARVTVSEKAHERLGAMTVATGASDSSGRFLVSDLCGDTSHSLKVMADGYADKAAVKIKPAAGGKADCGDIVLERATLYVNVTVVDESGTPVESADVSVGGLDGGLQNSATDSKGTARLGPFGAGKIHLYVHKDGFFGKSLQLTLAKDKNSDCVLTLTKMPPAPSARSNPMADEAEDDEEEGTMQPLPAVSNPVETEIHPGTEPGTPLASPTALDPKTAEDVARALAEEDAARAFASSENATGPGNRLPGTNAGVFLLDQSPRAVPIRVKSVFKDPESDFWKIDPREIVSVSEFRFARAGGLYDQTGRNEVMHSFEKDSKGYWTHLYMDPRASARLDKAIKERGAVLVLAGVGKGRLEPIEVTEGHWGLANIKYNGPGLLLAVQINAEIMAAWNETGRIPPESDASRKEVEHSIRDSIKRSIRFTASCGFGQEVHSDVFCRSGEIGLRIYADLVDSGDIGSMIRRLNPDLDATHVARSFSINTPLTAQAGLMRLVKDAKFRRAMAPGFADLLRRDIGLGRPEAYQELELLLEDPDPVIVCHLAAVSPSKIIQKHRSSIVEKLNSCLSSDEVPGDAFLYGEMLDKIAETQLTECVAALTHHLNRNPKANLDHGIRTLGRLRAFPSLLSILTAHPALEERKVESALGFLQRKGFEDVDLDAKADALVSLSQDAIEGRWPAPEASQRRLVYEMLAFIAANAKGVPPKLQEKAAYRRVRLALHAWLGKPVANDLLERLAIYGPQPDEIPLFIEGLKSPDPQTASECIQALGRLVAREAIPALVAVLDRPDAIADLHPGFRKMTQEVREKISVGYPPADRDNLAYQADVVLTKLAGGDPSKVPPYANEEILEQRREYWKQWLKSGGPGTQPTEKSPATSVSRSAPAADAATTRGVGGLFAPDKPAIPGFEELAVEMKCSWWNGVNRVMRIGGDGKVAFSLVSRTGQDYESTYQLSKEDLATLAGLLRATDWLRKPPEKVMAKDAVEFSLSLKRSGETARAEFLMQRTEPYQPLERFLTRLAEQEHLLYCLSGGKTSKGPDAVSTIASDLRGLMRRPDTVQPTEPRVLDYSRFLPIMREWLAKPDGHPAGELEAAVLLAGYLRDESARNDIESLMMKAKVGAGEGVPALVRIGNPASVPVLGRMARRGSGSSDAAWGLVQMGDAALPTILEIVGSPIGRDGGDPTETMIRAYVDHWKGLPAPPSAEVIKAVRADMEARRQSEDHHPSTEYHQEFLRLLDDTLERKEEAREKLNGLIRDIHVELMAAARSSSALKGYDAACLRELEGKLSIFFLPKSEEAKSGAPQPQAPNQLSLSYGPMNAPREGKYFNKVDNVRLCQFPRFHSRLYLSSILRDVDADTLVKRIVVEQSATFQEREDTYGEDVANLYPPLPVHVYFPASAKKTLEFAMDKDIPLDITVGTREEKDLLKLASVRFKRVKNRLYGFVRVEERTVADTSWSIVVRFSPLPPGQSPGDGSHASYTTHVEPRGYPATRKGEIEVCNAPWDYAAGIRSVECEIQRHDQYRPELSVNFPVSDTTAADNPVEIEVAGAPPEGPTAGLRANAEFEKLSVEMRCNWWGGIGHEIQIAPTGHVRYAQYRGEERDKALYASEFDLSAERLAGLTRILEKTDWFQMPPEKVAATDVVEFKATLTKDGSPRSVEFEFMAQPLPYSELETFLGAMEGQESLLKRQSGDTILISPLSNLPGGLFL